MDKLKFNVFKKKTEKKSIYKIIPLSTQRKGWLNYNEEELCCVCLSILLVYDADYFTVRW